MLLDAHVFHFQTCISNLKRLVSFAQSTHQRVSTQTTPSRKVLKKRTAEEDGAEWHKESTTIKG